jgi:hypothetical protein
MGIKYTNIFHSKPLQNFWFENKPSGNPEFEESENGGAAVAQLKVHK